jgi:ankyrin repeat protein
VDPFSKNTKKKKTIIFFAEFFFSIFSVNVGNTWYSTAVHLCAGAVSNGREMLEVLLRERADEIDVNRRNGTGKMPLHFCREADAAAVLLHAGADVSVEDSGGWPPLLDAVRRENVEVFELLVAAGADPHFSNGIVSLLHVAASARPSNEKLVRRLIELGVELDMASDGGGVTPLHMLVRCGGDESVAKLLLNAGANPNHVAGYNGFTPLHSAAKSGYVELAALLLSAGADANALDELDRSPLWHAASNWNDAIVRMLLQRGAVRRHGARDKRQRNVVQRFEAAYRRGASLLLLCHDALIEEFGAAKESPAACMPAVTLAYIECTRQALLDSIEIRAKDLNALSS